MTAALPIEVPMTRFRRACVFCPTPSRQLESAPCMRAQTVTHRSKLVEDGKDVLRARERKDLDGEALDERRAEAEVLELAGRRKVVVVDKGEIQDNEDLCDLRTHTYASPGQKSTSRNKGKHPARTR